MRFEATNCSVFWFGVRSAERRGRGKSFPQPDARPLICAACRSAKNTLVRKRLMPKLLIYIVKSAVLKTGER